MAPIDSLGEQIGSGELAGVSADEFRRVAHTAVDLVADYLSSMRARPVFTPMEPAQREQLIDQPLPEVRLAPQTILKNFADAILTQPMGNGHPRFFGWVNSPPAPMGIIGEFLAAAINPSCAGGDHAAIYLERAAVRWLAELAGFPLQPNGMGLLVSGGSMAALTCLAAARHRAALVDGWNVRQEGLQGSSRRAPLVLYLSEEGHSCLRKAAELLGIGSSQIRTVPTDSEFRLELPALRDQVRNDRAAGLRPFCVAASAGTVNTGAIDPIEELAGFCGKEALWLHVDGAYGAFGILDETVAPRYQGLAKADSLALDPHKWLSVPVECGCALVRDGKTLRDTFSLVPPYLRTQEGKGFGGLPWFSEYGFQQTRGFRALKLWMTICAAGRAGIASHVKRHNALARRLAGLVEVSPDLQVLAPVVLSIVCFRYVPGHLRGQDEQLDTLNKNIMEQVQAGGEAFVSGTTLRNRFALRACVLNYDTVEDDLVALVQLVRNLGVQLSR